MFNDISDVLQISESLEDIQITFKEEFNFEEITITEECHSEYNILLCE